MSETQTTPESTPQSQSDKGHRCDGRCARRGGRGRRWGRRLGVLAVLAIGLFALPRAFGWGGGHCDRDAAWTAEEVREKMSFVSDRALDHVDATDEQYAAIEEILDRAAPELVGLREEGRDLRERLRVAIVEHPEDRAALEALRQEGLALADRASKAALEHAASAAATLTPEQRAELAERMAEHHRQGPRGHGPR